MGFEGFKINRNDVKNISEGKISESLGILKNEIDSQIKDKSLTAEAYKELQEFKNKIKKNKDLLIHNSKLVLDDLKQELLEDLNALNDLEDKFPLVPHLPMWNAYFNGKHT